MKAMYTLLYILYIHNLTVYVIMLTYFLFLKQNANVNGLCLASFSAAKTDIYRTHIFMFLVFASLFLT